MRIESAAQTSVGSVRENNEDAFACFDDRGVYAVADGMGGHAAGEVASAIAIRALEIDTRNIPPQPYFSYVFAAAHRRILREAVGERAGMGTTLTACGVDRDLWRLYVAHCGDSRLYLLRGECRQITEDQTSYGGLSSGLGVKEDFFKGVAYSEHRLKTGDVIVLATDGLGEVLTGVSSEAVRIMRGLPMPALANALIDKALANGGRDNVTVVCVRVS